MQNVDFSSVTTTSQKPVKKVKRIALEGLFL